MKNLKKYKTFESELKDRLMRGEQPTIEEKEELMNSDIPMQKNSNLSGKDKNIVNDLYKYVNIFIKNNDFMTMISSLMGYTFKDYTNFISIRYCNFWGSGKPSLKLDEDFSIEIYDKSDILWHFCKKRFDININGRIKYYDYVSKKFKEEIIYTNGDIYKELMNFFENKIQKLNNDIYNKKSKKPQILKDEWQEDTSTWDNFNTKKFKNYKID